MRKFFTLFISVAFCNLNAATKNEIESFLNEYAKPAYQDLVIDNQFLRSGTDMCHVRYEMIKPILDCYNGKFSILDLGAAKGYFSFRTAHDYPNANCVMIGANDSYYRNHADMILRLCKLNMQLSNITYLNKLVNLSDLKFMNRYEHFDVLLALLVVHMMDKTYSGRAAIIKNLLSLADNVIVEVSNDVAPDLADYVEKLSKNLDCIYLGEVRRHNYLASKATGKLFCFTRKTPPASTREGISKETAIRFNQAYP